MAGGGTLTAAWLSRRAGGGAADPKARHRRSSPAAADAVQRDLAEPAEQFLEIARRVARMEAGAVFRLEAGGTFEMVAERGVTAAELMRLRSRPLEGSHLGEAVRAGRLVVADLTQSPLVSADLRAALVAAGHRTILALPISIPTGTWGALALVSSEARQLTPDEIALLEAVAVQLGQAVTRAALAAEAQENGRRLEALARLTETLTATLALDEVLRRVVEAAVRIFDASEARLWLLGPDGHGLSLGASSGSGAAADTQIRLPGGESLVEAIVARRASVVVSDIIRETRIRNVERVRVAELASFAGVPVVLGERIVAVLTIATRRRHEYTAEEIELLGSLANHAAVAIDNARRFEEEQTRRAQLAALLDINKRIGAAESTDALLGAIAEEAARLLQVDNAGFRLVEGEELVVAGLAGTAAQTMLRPRIKIGESFSGRVVKEGRTIVADIAGVPELLPEHRAADERLGYTAFLGVPLRAGPRIIGVLAFRARRPFTARDRELVEAFADQAAVALENARLLSLEQAGRAQIETLAEIEREFAAELNIDRLLRLVVDRAGRLFGARGGIFLVQGDRCLVPRASNEREFFNRTLAFGQGLSGICAEERRGLLVNDYPASPYALADFVAAGVRRMLAHPLILRDSLLGVISLARTGEHAPPFGTENLAVLESFATQAAIAIQNARLHEEAEHRRQEAEALAALAQRLTETLEVSAVAERIVESVQSLLHVSSARLRLLQPDGSLVVMACGGPARSVFPPGHVQPAGVGISARAVAEGRAVWSADVTQDPAVRLDAVARQELLAAGFRASLAVPLHAKGRIIGVLLAADESVRTFLEDEIALAQAFADQAALALENARLHEETERRRREAEVMAELARSINASLDVDTVLQRIAEGARELCGSDLARIGLREPESEAVVFRYGVGTRYDAYPTFRAEPGKGLSGQVLATGQPFRTDNYGADPRITRDYARIAEAEAMVTVLSVPIRIGSRVEGLIDVSNRSPRPFTERHETTLLQLAEHAAIAIQNARLYEALESRAKRLRTLTDVNRFVSSSLDTAEVLRTIARAAAELMGAPFVAFWVADESAQVLRISALSDERLGADFPLSTLAFGQGATGWVAAHRRALNIPDAFTDTRYLTREWSARHGVTSFYGVPILHQDTLLGVLAMNGRAPLRLTRDEESLLESFAAQAAVALQHARLYAEAEERLRETTTLLAVGQVMSQPGSVGEMTRKMVREVARALGADTGIAYRVEPEGEGLAPVAGYHVPRQLLDERFVGRRLTPARHTALLDIVRAGRAVSSSDGLADPRFDAAVIQGLPPHSVLFAPTTARGHVSGGLSLLWWRTGREFAPAEIRLVEGVAAQLGLALENAELARQRELRLQETETLLSVSRTLSSTLDLGMLLRHFMRQINRTVGADVVGVWMLDEDGERMVPKAGYRLPPEWLPALASLQLSIVDHAFYAEAAQTRRPVFARDVTTDARVPPEVYTATPHRSQLFVPILAKGRLIAGFVAAWLAQSRDFSTEELALIEAIAAQAGAALENARLFEQNRRQVEELTVLHELSRAVTGQLDEAALLEAIRLQLPRVLAVDKLVVLLADEKTDELEVVLRVQDGQPDATGPRRYARTVGLASVVLETGRPLRTADYPGECARRGIARPPVAGPPHWLGVPLMAGHTVLGVLAVSRRQGPFTDGEERVIVSIADLAALALRSARLFEERTRAYGELAAAQDHLVRTEKLRALGEMASGVAHDFNNLLAAILGRAQLLLRRTEDPRLRQWLQVIERSAVDGAQTVRRLQEFARVRRDEPLVPVDLNQVVRDALEITQSRWREEALRRGVMIDVQTQLAPIPPVAGDAAELREVMTNLILNAVDAMPDGGSLSLASATVDGQPELAVTDTGVGIPEAIREKIFDPFFTTKGPQGTGLGLSMTYGILSRHGATITVESAEGRGSTFRLIFPPLTVENVAAAEPPAPAAPVGAMRCLVVDDEPSVGEVIGDVLETLGHRAVVLTEGAQAIERFRAEPFDVVFTDLAMPGLSGWQVARAVKAVAPEVSVFVVTGFGVELSAEERRAHGVEAIFSKPLRIEDVMNAMEQVARKRPGPA